MKLLKEITEKDLNIENAADVLGESFKVRKSARGILLNDKGEVSLQFVSKYNYYKLPGGGIEKGESIEGAMCREIREEVGCEIEIGNPVGVIIEYRNQRELIHISYAYIIHTKGEIGQPTYEEGEIADGLQAVWHSIDDAVHLMETHKAPQDNYKGLFVAEREFIFLKEAVKILGPGNNSML